MTVSNKTLYAVVDEWVKRFGVRPSTVSKTALVKELEKCFMEDMEWEYVEWCSCKDGPADSSCTPDCIDGVAPTASKPLLPSLCTGHYLG